MSIEEYRKCRQDIVYFIENYVLMHRSKIKLNSMKKEFLKRLYNGRWQNFYNNKWQWCN